MKILSDGVRLLRSFHIPVTSADRRVSAFRNIHVGETCFILGSGPSLRIDDLGRLKKSICFGVNKIYLAFPKTEWRPTYYVLADKLIAEQVQSSISQVTCPRFVERWASEPVKNIGDWIILRESSVKNRLGFFSTNLISGTGGGATVLYVCLQLAYYMGFKRAILLGVDFSYTGLKPTGATSEIGESLVRTSDVNYFLPGYTSPNAPVAPPRYEDQRLAFKSALKAFENDGRELLNASRQTALDVIPQVRFDDILPA